MHRRNAASPRLGALQLRGDADQKIFPPPCRAQLHTDGQCLRRPVQWQTDRRLSGGVEEAAESRPTDWVCSILSAERWWNAAGDRCQQQIKSTMPPRRKLAAEDIHLF